MTSLARALCTSVHSAAAYLLSAAGEMIVVMKCRGEEAGNMLLRRTCTGSTSNHRKAFVVKYKKVPLLDLGKVPGSCVKNMISFVWIMPTKEVFVSTIGVNQFQA